MTFHFRYIIKNLTCLLFIGFAVALSSCDGDDGPQGPQGEAGDKGAKGDKGDKGDTGDTGAQGTTYYTKSGYFQGTLTGTRQDDTPFSEDFKYEYAFNNYEGTEDDEIELVRGDSITYGEDGPYLYMRFNVIDAGTANETVDPSGFGFNLLRPLDDNMLFRFWANFDAGDDSEAAATIVIDNYVHNMQTGAMSFDFTYTDSDLGYYNSTGHPVTITGSFNSGTGKVYPNVVNRKGN